MRTDTRRRLSRGSSEMQVSQSHAIEGTPVDVPVPRKVSFIFESSQRKIIFHLSFSSFHLSLSLSSNAKRPRAMTNEKYQMRNGK
jgi:hypothetical protein